MAAVDEVVAVTVKAKWVPTGTPTKAALEVGVVTVTSHEADLADAEIPLHAEQGRQVEADKAKMPAAEKARLSAIREEFGLTGGLPNGVFSLEPNNTQRLKVLMMRMGDVLDNACAYREHLLGKTRGDALTTDARRLIDEQKDARLLRIDGSEPTRLDRLQFDTRQHLSVQGQAAYPTSSCASRPPAAVRPRAGPAAPFEA